MKSMENFLVKSLVKISIGNVGTIYEVILEEAF